MPWLKAHPHRQVKARHLRHEVSCRWHADRYVRQDPTLPWFCLRGKPSTEGSVLHRWRQQIHTRRYRGGRCSDSFLTRCARVSYDKGNFEVQSTLFMSLAVPAPRPSAASGARTTFFQNAVERSGGCCHRCVFTGKNLSIACRDSVNRRPGETASRGAALQLCSAFGADVTLC